MKFTANELNWIINNQKYHNVLGLALFLKECAKGTIKETWSLYQLIKDHTHVLCVNNCN